MHVVRRAITSSRRVHAHSLTGVLHLPFVSTEHWRARFALVDAFSMSADLWLLFLVAPWLCLLLGTTRVAARVVPLLVATAVLCVATPMAALPWPGVARGLSWIALGQNGADAAFFVAGGWHILPVITTCDRARRAR